jgi:hypothetical protein
MSRDAEVDHTPQAILPNIDDQTHDHERRLYIYWNMLKCGFRLPLFRFEAKLLWE